MHPGTGLRDVLRTHRPVLRGLAKYAPRRATGSKSSEAEMRLRPSGEWDYRGVSVAASVSPSPAQRGNRRRLRVFLGTLAVALAISLGFTFLRQAEYRATALLQITPGSGSAPASAAASSAPDAAKPFLAEVQVLTSRPVLELAAMRLESAGLSLWSFGTDPVAGMQSSIQ